MGRKMVKKHEGREIRGVRFRLYTTPAQDCILRDYQEQLRRAWNWLCARARDVSDAREAYAARYHGVMRPATPDGELSAEQRAEYTAAMHAWRADVRRVCARARVGIELSARPECLLSAADAVELEAAVRGVTSSPVSYRSIRDWCEHFGVRHDYQMFRAACDVVLPAHMLQALCKDYDAALAATKRGQAPPSFKRAHDHVTLRSRSGVHFRLCEHGGTRPGCPNGRDDFLSCEVSLPGVPEWIKGRLDRGLLERLETEEYRLEGVSIVEEPDGWYAAIRQWVEPAPLHSAGPSAVSRWRGYGLPVAELPVDPQRSSNWIDAEYVASNGDRWTISVRDRGPQQDQDHRWRVSLAYPSGHRWDPNKSCPTQETAAAWARNRIDQYTESLAPGVTMRATDTQSPSGRGGELRVIGIDAGLADIATVWHEGQVLRSGNCRARDLMDQIARRQQAELPVGRLKAQAARRTWHTLRGVRAWVHEAQPDTVAIESGVPWHSIAQYLAREARGRTRRLGGYVPCFGRLQADLAADYGDRLQEVPREHTTDLRSPSGESLVRLDNETREVVDRASGARRNRDESAAREISRRGRK